MYESLHLFMSKKFFNWTVNDIEMGIVYPDYACTVAACFAMFFAVFGSAGNLITIVALLKCQRLRKHPTTYFLLSLTFSDFLFCMISMPMQSVRYWNKSWIFGDVLCKIFPLVLYSNIAISTLSMILMTLNRHCLISFQHLYPKIYKKSYIWLQLIAAWSLAILIMMLPMFGIWGDLGLEEETFSCTILKKNGKSPKKFIFLIGFVVPCCIIIVSYSCIFWTVQRQKQKLNKFDTSAMSMKNNKLKFFRNKNDLRLTVMMLTIFLCFVVCFLPLMMTNVFDDETRYPTLHIISSISAWSSAVINPIIYAVGSSQYRNAYKNLFVKIQTWKTSVSSGNNNNNKLPHSKDTGENSFTHQKLSSHNLKEDPVEIT